MPQRSRIPRQHPRPCTGLRIEHPGDLVASPDVIGHASRHCGSRELPKQRGDRVPGEAGHPRDGSDRVALDQRPDDRRPFGPAQLVHSDTMRERSANSLSQAGAVSEKRLGSGGTPAGERSLASAIGAFLWREGRGSGLATLQPAAPTKLDSQRVLRRTRRVRLTLSGGEVHYGLGELVRVSGHSGALWHDRIMGPTARTSQPRAKSN